MSRFSSSGVKRNNERISNCTADAVSKHDDDDDDDDNDDDDQYDDNDDDGGPVLRIEYNRRGCFHNYPPPPFMSLEL